jgi:protein-tyrosine phosphatase
MQVNASFFTSFASKRKALSLLREGSVHFVGSDSHNMSSRPPRVGKAFEVIQKKLGENHLKQMNEYGHSLLVKVNK